MSSYPGESAHTWSHQPSFSYHRPDISLYPHQTHPSTGLQPFHSAYGNGGIPNWQGNEHDIQVGAALATHSTTLPYPRAIHRESSWDRYQHPPAAFPVHPYDNATTSSPVMMPPKTSQYGQRSQFQDYETHNHTASTDGSWHYHAGGPQGVFASHGSSDTPAAPLSTLPPSATGPLVDGRHQSPYYSDGMDRHPVRDFDQIHKTSAYSFHNAHQTRQEVDCGDGDDDLQALDFCDPPPGSVMQRRIQAMTANIDEDDTLQSNQLIVVSQFFRNGKEEVYLANIKNKTDGEILKEDPMFADIPQDGEVTTFEELDIRKQTLLSSMAFDTVDNYLQSSTDAEVDHPGRNADHRALSVEQEHRLAALGVTGPPKPVQAYDPSTTEAPSPPLYDLRPVNDTYREQMHPTEPQQTKFDSQRVNPSNNDSRKQNNNNQGSKNKKNKDKKKRQNQQHKQQGRTQARYRGRSPSTLSSQHYDPRHDHAGPPSSGHSQQRSNEQGRKRAYEEPRQYVRSGDGGTPGKRRKN
ncbi:hypothetical protein EDD37DRAFT_679856 [Exophiala viscosa]|uniref:uncharacterized protein n=1 Tax=Exophiala viscosa TaxID=2486360 RepID=UPI00219BB49E|nr:hypothetical protein EDD37DRAFT_679856 [Exophiala viscosa]